MVKIKLYTLQRCLQGTSKSCVYQGPRERTPTKEPVLPVRVWGSPAEAWVSSGLLRWWGTDSSSPGKCSEWHKSSWRKSPLAPLESHPVGNPQIREQFYLRSSWTVAKLLGPTRDFQTWKSGKSTENPRETESWRAQQNLLCTRTQEKGTVTPEETCLLVSSNLQWRHGLVVACCRVRGTEHDSVCMGPFEGVHHYLHYLHHNLVSGQKTGRGHSPAHQQKIELKVYWAWPCPPEQDPVSLTVSLPHQEASISLLSLSMKGWTESKSQTQKTNQSDHMDHRFV